MLLIDAGDWDGEACFLDLKSRGLRPVAAAFFAIDRTLEKGIPSRHFRRLVSLSHTPRAVTYEFSSAGPWGQEPGTAGVEFRGSGESMGAQL
jgi:hypothetical protein